MLQRLISDRRISAGEVSRYMGDIQREISDLESRLRSLRETHGGGGGATGGGETTARRRGRPPGSGRKAAAGGGAAAGGRRRGRPGRPPGRPPGGGGSQAAGAQARGRKAGAAGRRSGGAALTAEQRASRQLQGRYLGLIRQIPAAKRAQYAKTAKEQGREAAIKQLQEALKK